MENENKKSSSVSEPASHSRPSSDANIQTNKTEARSIHAAITSAPNVSAPQSDTIRISMTTAMAAEMSASVDTNAGADINESQLQSHDQELAVTQSSSSVQRGKENARYLLESTNENATGEMQDAVRASLAMQQREMLSHPAGVGVCVGGYPHISVTAMQIQQQMQQQAHQQQLMSLMMGRDAGAGLVGPSMNLLQMNPLTMDEQAVRIQAATATMASNVGDLSRVGDLTTTGRQTFPLKLHEILDDPNLETIISWAVHGRAWRVHDTKIFALQVLPRHFKHSSYKSFTRQVNFWGFNRITSGPDQNYYYHECFLRGNPELCRQMIRKKQSNKRRSGGEGPDFYQMPTSGEDPRTKQQNGKGDAANLDVLGSLRSGAIATQLGSMSAGLRQLNYAQQHQNQMLIANGIPNAGGGFSALSAMNRGIVNNSIGTGSNLQVDVFPMNESSSSALSGFPIGRQSLPVRNLNMNLVGHQSLLGQSNGCQGSAFNSNSNEIQRILLRQALYGVNANTSMLQSQQLMGGVGGNVGVFMNSSVPGNGIANQSIPDDLNSLQLEYNLAAMRAIQDNQQSLNGSLPLASLLSFQRQAQQNVSMQGMQNDSMYNIHNNNGDNDQDGLMDVRKKSDDITNENKCTTSYPQTER